MRSDVEIEKHYERVCTIFVDADACPVKNEILNLAKSYHVSVIFVSSYNHVSNRNEGQWVYVDTNQEEVDLYIANRVRAGDLVVTQDIGLAGLLLKKDVYVLSPRGKKYNESNIENELFTRYVHGKQRRAGQKTKGPKRYTEQDRMQFQAEFEKILSNLAGF